MGQNGATRMLGVKTGATYWLENAAVENDKLCIVWYDSNTDLTLNLTDFTALGDAEVQNLINDINAQIPDGNTNIRDGLRASLNELMSPGNGAALQAALLLTDGAHNTPAGTSMLEVIPDFQAANTNIYSLGIGADNQMDLDGLDELAKETGGTAFSVADGSVEIDVRNSMMEINNLIRGGLVATENEIVPDAPQSSSISLLKLKAGTPFKKRPPLKELLEKLKEKDVAAVLKSKKIPKGYFKSFILEVEKDAKSASFHISFEQHTHFWLYLIDPSGKEIRPDSPELLHFSGNPQRPYEFAKIKKPMAGRWRVLAFRPTSGAASRIKAFAGIQHPEIYAFGKAFTSGDGIVQFQAGARFKVSLSGIYANVRIRDAQGQFYSTRLDNGDDEPIYTAKMELPEGHYHGYVEVRSPGNTSVANPIDAIHKALNPKNPPSLTVKHPAFKRDIPLSFYVGHRGTIVPDKYEKDSLSKQINEKYRDYYKK